MTRGNDTTDNSQKLRALRAKLVKISNEISASFDTDTDNSSNSNNQNSQILTLAGTPLATQASSNPDTDARLATDIIPASVTAFDRSNRVSANGCDQCKTLTECVIELVDYIEALTVSGNYLSSRPTTSSSSKKMLTLLKASDTDSVAANSTQAMTKLESLLATANDAKRLTKKLVQQIVAEPVSPELFGSASRYNRPISIREHRLAVRIIELIGKYGPMTTYQLRAWLLATETWSGNNNDSDSPFNLTPDNSAANFSESLRVLTTYALRHAHSVGLISYFETPNWYNPNRNSKKVGHQVKLWTLERTGLTFYQMQTQNKSFLEKVGSDYAKQKEHTFGVQQTLAIFNMVCATGKLLNSITKKLNESPTIHTPTVAPISHIEVMPWGSGINVPKLGLLKPDILGRIILQTYDSATNQALTDEAINRLTKAANIPPVLDYPTLKSTNPKLEEAEQETLTYNNRNELESPFAGEYDRATESPEVFAKTKYPKYAELYTQSFLSTANLPAVWQEKFPVVLVITEGNNKHLLEMMREVKNLIKANKSHHRYSAWWFTRLEWFKLAYGPYQNESNLTNWQKEWLTLLKGNTDIKPEQSVLEQEGAAYPSLQRTNDASLVSGSDRVRRSLATIDVRSREFTLTLKRTRIWIPAMVMLNDEQRRANNPNENNKKPILAMSQLNKLNSYYSALYRQKDYGAEIIQQVEAGPLFKQMTSLPILHPLNLPNR